MQNQAANEHILKIRSLCHCCYALITSMWVSGRVCTCFIYLKNHYVPVFCPLRACAHTHSHTRQPPHCKNKNLFICFHWCPSGGSIVVGYTFFWEPHQLPVLSPGPLGAIGDKNRPTWPNKQQKRVLFLESILNTYHHCLEGCQV